PSFVRTAPPPTPLSPLSLHDPLPISTASRAAARAEGGVPARERGAAGGGPAQPPGARGGARAPRRRRGRGAARAEERAAGPAREDRKSTRLNSSHVAISYAVFCLKKK